MAKVKTKAAVARVPQTKEEAVTMIAAIGGHQRDRQRTVAKGSRNPEAGFQVLQHREQAYTVRDSV